MSGMTQNDLLHSIKSVEGWLSDREGMFLYECARRCSSEGVIVEIGSWKGRSTIWLAHGSKSGGGSRIYAVDPHVGSSENRKALGEVWTFEEFKGNLKRLNADDNVTPLVMTSEKAAGEIDEDIEFIFIDGAHEYEYVKLDFDLWFPKVVDGGVMAFHDTKRWLGGPKRVVRRNVYWSKRFKDVGFVDTITYATKVEMNTSADRLRNFMVFLALHFLGFPHSFIVSKVRRILGKGGKGT